jgi:hypothetical protein
MAYNNAYDAQGHLKYSTNGGGGSLFDDFFKGLGNTWNDITGGTKANMYQNELAQQQAKANASADLLQKQGQDYRTQGDTATGQASKYFNNWMNDPSAAWNSTAGIASGIGGAMAGQATDQAVNAARGSGLNAGQAGLAAGANTANQFTNSTLGAQNSLIGNQMGSANSLSKQGLAEQGLSNDALTGGGKINTDIAKQNADLYTSAQDSATKASGNIVSNIADRIDPRNKPKE